MDNRDKIQALWLNLAIILNQLEELGENIRATDDAADDADIIPRVYGFSGGVRWDVDTQNWVPEKP